VEDLNKTGGIKGIQLELVPFDDGCDAAQARSRAAEIVANNEYQAVIGPLCSSACISSINYFKQKNLLVVSPSATNARLAQMNMRNLFRLLPNDQKQAASAANFIGQKLKAKNVALLHTEDMYSKDLADLVAIELTKNNSNPAMYHFIKSDQSNFKELIAKIKQLNIDAIYFAGMYPEVARLVKHLDVKNIKMPIITSDANATSKFITEVGGANAANALLMTFGQDPTKFKANSKILHSLTKDDHKPVDSLSLYAYAAIEVISQAISNADTTEGKALTKWLQFHHVNTVLGTKSWDTNGELFDSDYIIYAWQKDGSYKKI
jgi:branched-chain amino acid transport system substrate-binding protein